jgi:hypothetical protein
VKGYANPGIRLVLLGFVVGLTLGARSANADFTFGEATNLGPNINSPVEEGGVCISPDGLELYFCSFFEGFGIPTFRMARRERPDDPWGEAVNVEPPFKQITGSCISADGLSLYFDSDRPGGLGGGDIWVATRASISDPWIDPVDLSSSVNSSDWDLGPSVSGDGLELYFGSARPGGAGDWDVWVSTRETVSNPWGKAVNLGPTVNSVGYDGHPFVSHDGLMLFITSNRPGGYGDWDIWLARRATRDDDWGKPVNLGPSLNTADGEAEPYLSTDGRTLYFSDWWAPRPGGSGTNDIWQAPVLPVVDFNGDGKVNGTDVLSLAAHWDQDYPPCDIGPTPLGDGTIDLQDLIVLADYIGEEVDDPSLVAHWAFDETEGSVAHNSAANSNSTIVGLPAWQPAGGKVGGAIELTGTTFVMGGFVLNPSSGPFSVLAWIKGGQPGQGIVAQSAGMDWLAVDAVDGKLTTDLSRSLYSETVITDGDWHRIAVTWDGDDCLLYVDDILEAQSAKDALNASAGGVVIGCRRTMAPGTFFTGLIDDVRIYSRAVKP